MNHKFESLPHFFNLSHFFTIMLSWFKKIEVMFEDFKFSPLAIDKGVFNKIKRYN